MSHTVELQPSGRVVSVDEGESILEAAIRDGIMLPYNCRSGRCGACAGRLLTGQVSYANARPEGLTEADMRDGRVLCCQARPATDITLEIRELTGVADLPVRKLPCRVAKMERLAHDVLRLYLTLPKGERLQFLAGQYIEFVLKDGRRRAFSIANAPEDDAFIELHVRQVGGGEFTRYVFEQLREKTILRLEGPLGTFYLRERSDRPIIFMAGGSGFAPIKGMIEHAFAQDIQRPMHLYWGARARHDLYLDALPRQWAAEHKHFTYTPVLSAPNPQDEWRGRTGLVHEAIVADHVDLGTCEVYASGPPAMVEAGHQAFATRGLAPEHYFSDAFEFARDGDREPSRATS